MDCTVLFFLLCVFFGQSDSTTTDPSTADVATADIRLTTIIKDTNGNPNCDEPWNASATNEIIVRWDGVDRDGQVEIIVTPENPIKPADGKCVENEITATGDFADKQSPPFEPPCLNSKYEIKVSLVCDGTVIGSKPLVVWTPPDVPSHVRAEDVELFSFLLKWDPPPGTIEGYKIRLNGTILETTATSLHMNNLESNALYIVKVSAINEFHQGKWSKKLEIRTKIDLPTLQEVRSGDVTDKTIEVLWEEAEEENVTKILYSVQWHETDDVTKSESEVDIDSNSYTIRKLLPYTNYSIRVRAYVEKEFGDWSHAIAVMTKAGVPSKPRNVTEETIDSISVKIKWLEPFPAVGQIRNYTVALRKSDDVIEREHVTKNSFYLYDGLTPLTVYEYRVLARTDAGPGDWSAWKSFKTKEPLAPENLRRTTATGTTLFVEWDEPQSYAGKLFITTYTVRWYKSESASNISTQNTAGLSIYIKNLEPLTNYSVQVKSWTKDGDGSWTSPLIAETGVGVPLPPDIIKEVEVTNSSIEVKWEVQSFYKEYVTLYSIQWGKADSLERQAYNSVDTSYLIEDLDPFTNYSIQVLSWTEEGDGAWSKPIFVKTKIGVPSFPKYLKEKSTTNKTIEIRWEEPDPTNGPIEFYTVRWTEMNSGMIMTNTTEALSYVIENLKPFTNYSIDVSAATSKGSGEWSEPLVSRTDIGVPSFPRHLKEKSTTKKTIQIRWEEPDPANGPIEFYTVRWTEVNSGMMETNTTVALSYVIENLKPFTNYSIHVSAATREGSGEWSEPLISRTDIGVPLKPIGVKASVTDTSISLVWEEPAVDMGWINHYTVRWTDEVLAKMREDTAKDLSYTIKGLTPYTNYYVVVSASTVAGEGEGSDPKIIRTAPGVPIAPLNLVNVTNTNLSIYIKWDEPEVFNGPILLYTVRWIHDVSRQNWTDNADSENYNITSLEPYTVYKIDVRAKTEAGFGPWSDVLTLRTAIGIPSIPREVIIKNTTAWTIQLTWTAPESMNGPLENYLLKWRRNGSPAVTNFTEQTSFEATGLIPYTEYLFQVSACTKRGCGAPSAVHKNRTDIAIPSAPVGVLISAFNTSLVVKWSLPDFPNGPILDYAVEWKKVDGDFEPITIATDSQNCTITDLDPYTNYTIQVAARTFAGFGPWTDVFEAMTKITVPKAARIFEVRVESSTSISVDWGTPSPYPGPTVYELQVWRKPGRCEYGNEAVQDTFIGGSKARNQWEYSRPQLVDKLKPYHQYYVRVVLKTDEGESISANSSVVETSPMRSGSPLQVQADCTLHSTEVEVKWKRPRTPNGKIVLYLVRYGVEGTAFKEETVQVTNECRDHSLKIEHLRPERKYKISVSAQVENVPETGEEADVRGNCILPAGVPPLGNEENIGAEGSGPYSLSFKWSKDVFSEDRGELVNYAVLVALSEAVGNASSGQTSEIFPTWSNFSAGLSDFYQATPHEWNPFHKDKLDPLDCMEVEKNRHRTIYKCTLGLEDSCSSEEPYCNGPLRPETTYGMKVRAFTRGGFAETRPLFATTGSVPTPSVVGPLVGCLIVLILIGGLTGTTLILKKKGKLKDLRTTFLTAIGRRNSAPQPSAPSAMELESAAAVKPLTIQVFPEHVRLMMSDSHLRFSQEFENLKKNSPKFPCATAEMDENRQKNRWLNILPYDHARVKLLPLGDELASDYINANYIPGHSSLREYIATQGPVVATVDDFWRMVWEQSVTMIVMLTQCVERGKNKCEQYWPSAGEARHYGDIQVRTLSESMLSSYTIRLYHLQLGSQERKVKQMHFTHWPDFGCPERPDDLINFLRAVRDHLPRVRPGPILVHCSAGVGRTGTFITVDRIMQQQLGNIDIYGTVMELRHHRINMVQTEDQYIYIHSCVLQLVNEMNKPADTETEEAIYSNISIEQDTGV